MLTRALTDCITGSRKLSLARDANLARSPANQILRTTEMQMTAGFAALIRSRLRNPG